MELEQRLQFIFSQFKTESSIKEYKLFSSGHINDTYLIITDSEPYYVLQKINSNVFKNALAVINNKFKITKYLLNKGVKSLRYIPTADNSNYYLDANGDYWNLCLYLNKTKTILNVHSPEIALEAGKSTAHFLSSVSDFPGDLEETIPDFHNMRYRFSQFDEALQKASEMRKKEAELLINYAYELKNEMLVLDTAINQNKIPLRITHNDTKSSNILFDDEHKAICLIDLDTVGYGAIHFDYGDALRTICSTSDEDEKDISKTEFNMEYFKNYTHGFLSTLTIDLHDSEIKYLPLSPRVMTFIMGLRFLTDFLNNDVYYKTNHENHNFDRAINQFALVEDIVNKQEEITAFVHDQIS